MPGPEFFQTKMGKKFFESDFPRLVDRLTKIAFALEDKKKEEVELPKEAHEYIRNKYGISGNESIGDFFQKTGNKCENGEISVGECITLMQEYAKYMISKKSTE